MSGMRFAATLEFLRAIAYDFTQWAEDDMGRMEKRSARPTRSRRLT
jgi:hypothetical protein